MNFIFLFILLVSISLFLLSLFLPPFYSYIWIVLKYVKTSIFSILQYFNMLLKDVKNEMLVTCITTLHSVNYVLSFLLYILTAFLKQIDSWSIDMVKFLVWKMLTGSVSSFASSML